MNSSSEAWQSWCASRVAGVQAVPGNLSLVEFQSLSDQWENVDLLPGLRARADVDSAGVWIDSDGEVAAVVDQVRVKGETFLARLRPDGGPLLRCGSHIVDAFSLDGSDYELRIYDEAAPNRANFAGIECYDHDPAWAVPGRFEPFAEADAVVWEFTRAADTGHTKRVPGTLVVTIDGAEHALQAFLDGPALVLVFADATTGVESYAPGRFLRMDQPAPGRTVEVDFNRAFIPPCGFSDFYSCPIPPAGNRLPAAVRAGEKRVLWHEPRY